MGLSETQKTKIINAHKTGITAEEIDTLYAKWEGWMDWAKTNKTFPSQEAEDYADDIWAKINGNEGYWPENDGR
jgi:DNA gyrase inhibitor GyrI